MKNKYFNVGEEATWYDDKEKEISRWREQQKKLCDEKAKLLTNEDWEEITDFFKKMLNAKF